ncbi:MAG: hypothetical protein HGA45_25975 [Chloroflexales bacterium]|nr:hypothetical protein [Chloroflexales bacterium]
MATLRRVAGRCRWWGILLGLTLVATVGFGGLALLGPRASAGRTTGAPELDRAWQLYREGERAAYGRPADNAGLDRAWQLYREGERALYDGSAAARSAAWKAYREGERATPTPDR